MGRCVKLLSMARRKTGKVIKQGGINVWPHEQIMADILAENGYIVEFIEPSIRKNERTPDVKIDGVGWELKSPRASSLKAVERNLKRGRWQSDKIVFASRRMKGIPDKAIERELKNRSKEIDGLSRIIFINRQKEIVDIKK